MLDLIHRRHQHLWDCLEHHRQTDPHQHFDLAHDHLHIKRVYQWAIKIAKSINVSTDLAGAAALLHDFINIPKESAQRSEGSTLSAIAGIQPLKEAQYSLEEIELITDAIRTCSWSKGLSPVNDIGIVLQDADRLDAIGAIGIMRNIACAQAMGTRKLSGQFYASEDPFFHQDRELDDKEFAIDHFFKKLLLIYQGFHTEIAQREGLRRQEFMQSFLKALELELPKGLDS